MPPEKKYIRLFGKIASLNNPMPWTSGVSNMLEWLTWSTNDVLGITKTQYWKKIANWASDDSLRNATPEQRLNFVKRQLEHEIKASEKSNPYDRRESRIASPTEALRRVKFLSEDYLNKEFDIFWTLVTDEYLDTFYGQFTSIKGGGSWATHGNSRVFETSTGIREMQMDNLSYNEREDLLVANELKLGGKKNPDQILKYALMVKLLRNQGFISAKARFLLLFISDTKHYGQWAKDIDDEIRHCRKSKKTTLKAACADDVVEIARGCEKQSTTWRDVIAFNELRLTELDKKVQQVEWKLLYGFNASLKVKKFMQPA